MDVALLLGSFAVILAGALLFTNAIEWIGIRLQMGQGAVGSLLAAVGTAMPETLIPVVAILGDREGAKDVAVGAIVGAPFLLATVAMMLVGLSAVLYRRRRPQGRALRAHMPTLQRDLGFFLIFFAAALVFGIANPPDPIRIAGALGFVAAYVVYVRRTLRAGGDVQEEDTIGPLIMDRRALGAPSLPIAGIQLMVGLVAIVAGAHLFVHELIEVSKALGAEPLILALVLAPLATELPEKANSFFWVRDGKDTLALGNITGAMVFQSTLPVALGVAFTDWDLDPSSIVSIGLGLTGGVVAYWALRLRGQFDALAIGLWGSLYAAFLIWAFVFA